VFESGGAMADETRAESDPEMEGFLRPNPVGRFVSWDESYVVVRFVVLRLLGLVYFVAFLVAALQFRPLIGERGLEPAATFLERLRVSLGSGAALKELPTLFWLSSSDHAIAFVAWMGVLLSLAVMLGVTNAAVMFVLWALYFSITQIGQIFWGYGWESQLTETGFLAMFLCPLRTLGPFEARAPPSIVILLLRWLIVRIMLGAGLIKLRGDPCWRDFTCLEYHYETQPIPNALSPLFNAAPVWFLKTQVGVNHLVEVVAPWFAFGPRRARLVAGTAFILFQITLILSGNLSFLNWLTIIPALACFDDRALLRLVPKRLRERVAARFGLDAEGHPVETFRPISKPHRIAGWAYFALVVPLSIDPVLNLLSERQAMNTSFEPFRLVNTYGAFGSVGKERYEVILEGTSDATLDENTHWQEYEFPCKPGDPDRRPCWISPYHERLDWQMWFAAFSPVRTQPWIVNLVYKLLTGDREIDRLLAKDPFPKTPPRFVRAELYRYRMARPGEKSWWHRERAGTYLPPLHKDSPALRTFLMRYGWLPAESEP
jgi:Lipase maturation factor